MSKIAVITGASRGIGKAIAEQLAKENYLLAISGRVKETLCETAKEIEETYKVTCLSFVGDMGDASFVEQMFREVHKNLGAVDVLINNAGISQIGLFQDLTIEEWNKIVNTNLTSVFLSCKQAIPQMLSKKEGRIINISSVWGNVGASCEVAYSATKGGINALTKALGKELAPSNITVNAIALGTIDTKMNSCFSPEERQQLEEEIPVGRYGTVEEVSHLVSQLLQAPTYLTGQIITMDGGWT